MSLKEKVGKEMIEAMKAREEGVVAKGALRSLKTAIVNAESEKGASGDLSEEKEMQILNKLVKQRKESADILLNSNRTGDEKERDIEIKKNPFENRNDRSCTTPSFQSWRSSRPPSPPFHFF